jgi:hypothetical protein
MIATDERMRGDGTSETEREKVGREEEKNAPGQAANTSAGDSKLPAMRIVDL